MLIGSGGFGLELVDHAGYTEILSNDESWYGEPRFNYYSAVVGVSTAPDQVHA